MFKDFRKLCREVGPWAAIVLYLYAWMWASAFGTPEAEKDVCPCGCGCTAVLVDGKVVADEPK